MRPAGVVVRSMISTCPGRGPVSVHRSMLVAPQTQTSGRPDPPRRDGTGAAVASVEPLPLTCGANRPLAAFSPGEPWWVMMAPVGCSSVDSRGDRGLEVNGTRAAVDRDAMAIVRPCGAARSTQAAWQFKEGGAAADTGRVGSI